MKNSKARSKKKSVRRTKTMPEGECQSQVLLRHVPCEVVELINRKKTEILTNNPYRTNVSNSEAIYKLILKG